LIAPDTSDALGLTRILIFLFSSGLLLIASIARSKLVRGLKKVGLLALTGTIANFGENCLSWKLRSC
jgi:hypothetical protein